MEFWYWKGVLHEMEIIDCQICYVDKPYEGIYFFYTKENKTRFLELRHTITGKKFHKHTSLNALTASTNVSPNYKHNEIVVNILIRGLENQGYIIQKVVAKRLMPQKAKEHALEWANYNPYIKEELVEIFSESKVTTLGG